MVLLVAVQLLSVQTPVDPFAFFQPTLTITADDRRTLDAGKPLVRVIPSRDLEVAIGAAVPVAIDGDRLVAWMRQIEALKKSAYVSAIRRFSEPPRLEDLAELTLDDQELSEIRACRPGDCGLKLTAAEMAELQHAAAEAGAERDEAMQNEFRRLVLRRVNAYLAGSEVGPFEDHSEPVWPLRQLAAIVERSPYLGARVPWLAAGLRSLPVAPGAGAERFLYWSNERIADRPIVSVTEVHILRNDAAGFPEVLVAGKGIFSTHYVNASLGITALVRGDAGGPNYLVYVNRSEVDVLRGMFAGLIRWIMQRRLKAEAGGVLLGLRHRLESGEPPASGHDTRPR